MARLHDIKPFTNCAHVGVQGFRDTAGYGWLVPFLMKRISIVVKTHDGWFVPDRDHADPCQVTLRI